MNKTTFKRIRIYQEWYNLYIKEESERILLKGFLHACYERPSECKEAIYKDCERRASDIAQCLSLSRYFECGVHSFNTNMFTFGANFGRNTKIPVYYFETKTRRELHITENFLDLICDRIQTAKECGYSISIELA